MSNLNPYQSPSTPTNQWKTQSDGEAVFRQAAHTLARTKPWVRFLAVLGFLGFASVILVTGLAMVLQLGATGGMAMLIVLPIAVVFYFVPSLLLWNYASRIGEFLTDETPQALAAAVGAQKSFWKYVGIAGAIGIAIYLGFFVIAGVLGTLG